MPSETKVQKVTEITERLAAARAAVLTGYRGLTVQEAAQLREALAEVETKFAVVKNSLTRLAVKEAGVEGLAELVDGPTAIAFILGDPVLGAKRLVEQVRRFPVLDIQGGLAEGRVMTADEIRAFAALDTREEMLATIAGLGKMQLSRTAWILQALQSKLLLLMEALKEKLPGAEPAEGSADAEDGPDPTAAPGSEEPEQPGPGPAAPAETPEAPAEEPAPETEPERPDEEEAPGEEPSETEPTEGGT